MHTQGVLSQCGRSGVCVWSVCDCGCSIEMSVYILLSYLLSVCWQNFKCAVMKLLATNAVNTRSRTHTDVRTHSDRQSAPEPTPFYDMVPPVRQLRHPADFADPSKAKKLFDSSVTTQTTRNCVKLPQLAIHTHTHALN